MLCYTHREQPAIGLCAGCLKGVCQLCAIECDDHLACCKSCIVEIREQVVVAEHEREVVGLRGKQVSMLTIVLGVAGFFLAGFGGLMALGGEWEAGVFPIAFGVMLAALAVFAYARQGNKSVSY